MTRREGEHRPVVLVTDDSAVIRAVLRGHLEEHGHVVYEAVDGEEALRVCAEVKPDVVLLDVEMPKLDGLGVLARLQADTDLADTPVVFCTGRTETVHVVEGLRLGAHDYLRKPFEIPELLARVKAAVRVKLLQDELRRRNEELDLLTRMDPLTGLPNRRHLQEHLTAESAATHRHGQSLALLMVDVDRFKEVNDSRGHEMGDLVLRVTAERLLTACRDQDMAGRWGGEEFLVIAPFTDLATAAILGEQIRAAVAAEPVRVDSGAGVAVTVSVGVSAGLGDVEILLREADEAMYAAKEAGRNCVQVAPER